MTEPSAEPKKPLGVLPFVLAGLAFIPAFGVLLGIPSIIWGFVTRSRGGLKVAVVAGTGVALNIIGYSILFYMGFAKKGGSFVEARRGLTQMGLRQAVMAIEYWHQQTGHYPDSLGQLVSGDSLGKVFLYDPNAATPGKQLPFFFYNRSTDRKHYWLRSLGPDGQPFTADDIVPQLPDSERVRTGLLVAPP